MPALFFFISASLALIFLIINAIFDNTTGKIFGYISIPFGIAAILLSAYAYRRTDVVLLVILALVLIYLLASVITVMIKRRCAQRKGGEESDAL